ncbi:uncharacterized protein LOC121382118 [Gigantopelta aegis]|uniref:uncharacterized protein LOC121382118 n=1 Tax=Gigantopelta aegis TaxID=1735272 RepID=UPI001B88C7F3|nr:uncharacterized protein LOC121382118 [Gigantopelta aegis]
MNALCFFVALAGVIQTIRGETCDACKTTYDAAVGVTGATDAVKCTAGKEFAACLVSASGAGCDTGTNTPTAQFNAATDGSMAKNIAALTGSCTLDALCTACQKDFQTAVLAWGSTTKDTTKCADAFTYASCVEMKPTTEKACDGTTDQAAMKTNSLAKAKAECSYAGSTAVKSSVVIMVSALFVSYLKF